MKITSIVENTSVAGLPVEHGLSLYIQLDNGRKVLFDMGQQRLFAENAERMGLSIADVDTAIVSHGHYDHGGGLGAFLEINDKAKVYIHRDAFQPHYSLRENELAYIGLDPMQLSQGCEADRVTMCGSVTKIDGCMTLFADVRGECCKPRGNELLFGPSETENDAFTHEQNLIIEEGGKVVLFAGCAHCGIVNIIRKAVEVGGKVPTHVFAGMHLANRHPKTVGDVSDDADEQKFIDDLSGKLMTFRNCKYYTMHCTGTEQYQKLRNIMENQITYLSCGESVEI